MYWFISLPDSASGRHVVENLGQEHRLLVAHASGRPWLVGQLPADQVRVVTTGRTRLAVLGRAPGAAALGPGVSSGRPDSTPGAGEPAQSGAGEESLRRRLARIRDTEDLTDLDAIAAALRGSCHLALSAHGRYRIQGTASGLRRVFRTRWQGLTLAADRADVLAALTGAPLDELFLALSLLGEGPPAPLDERSSWRGVDAVPSGSALTVAPGGTCRIHRWWRAPEPQLPLEAGAAALGEALRVAVADRVGEEVAAGRIPGCDVSGGMDSTALAFLARANGSTPVTCTVTYRDTANDDAYWAGLAQRHLSAPGVPTLRLAGEQVPHQYAGMEHIPPPTDAVSPMLRGRAVMGRVAAQYREYGVALQLAGHGGDETLQTTPGYLHTLARRHPRVALRHLRGYQAHRRWPTGRALSALMDFRPYAAWLADEAGLLRAPVSRSLAFGWGEPLRMAPWATDAAQELVADALRDAARTAEPADSGRGRHATLHRVRTAAQLYRLMRQEQPSPWIALPFLDDRVLEACLAVRPEERGTPYAYKPLLATALREIMPQALLGRATKGSTDKDFYEGLRLHRAHLHELVDHSPLAEHGLIDPTALRHALCTPGPRTSNHLEDTLGCEHWLRSIPAPGPHPPLERHP